MTGSRRYSAKLEIAAGQRVKERAYWLNKLSGEPVKSRFPHDFKRRLHTSDAEASGKFETETFGFSAGLSSGIMRLGRGSDHSLHIILTAGVMVMLHRYTGSNDIIVATPIYRQDIDAEIVNTVLLLRNRIEGGMTFKELLVQVKETLIEAIEHYGYPIEILMKELNMSPPGADSRWLDMAILLSNIHDKEYLRHVHPNMLFSFERTGRSIKGAVAYNGLLFCRATVRRVVCHFKYILDELLSALDTPLARLALLPENQRKQLLLDFNNTDMDYQDNRTVHESFEVQAERAADDIAIVFEERQFTYRELNERANRLAARLRHEGVKGNTIVGLLIEPCPEMIIGILGILKAGGAYLPLDPDFPENRILSILNDNGVSILLTGEEMIDGFVFTALENIKEGHVKPVVTPPQPPIEDFGGLPLPDRTLIDYEKYNEYIGIARAKHTISIQATRGCPFNCLFCHKIWPKTHVVRSAENIFEEILLCHHAGARRFSFLDDIFNLDRGNSGRLLQKIIEHRLDVQLYFPNGLRGDILTGDFIDLLIEAGTVGISIALETASPRIQKLLRKNLNLEKFQENVHYISRNYPQVILDLEMMIGFPTETEEEAWQTLNLLKSLRWIHFPNLNVLKIFPNTDMYQLAVENGISRESIERSAHLAYQDLPDTLPFSRGFAREYQARYMNEYFLSRQRLLHVLPYQMKVATEDELVQKYNSYLPLEIKSLADILHFAEISMEELGDVKPKQDGYKAARSFNSRIRKFYPPQKKSDDAFRILLLDLSVLYSTDSNMFYDMIEEPLGLMYLMTYLKKTFGARVRGRVAKSRMDFDSHRELRDLITRFKPDLIGIRTLSYYKEFFHRTVSLIRRWGVDIPIISGGPYATSDYKLILQDHFVDLVALGEGELTLAALVEKMLDNRGKLPDEEVLSGLRGLAFVKRADSAILRRCRRKILLMEEVAESWDIYPAENISSVSGPGDLLYLISTSGSTGQPKSVMLEHRNLVNLLNFEFSGTNLDFGGRVLQFASIGFDVSAQEIFSTLLRGGTLYLVNNQVKGDVSRLFDFIRDRDIGILFLPPAYLRLIFSESRYYKAFPPSVRHIVCAGEQLIVSARLKEYLRENRVYLHNHYGPSETHVVTTLTIGPGDEAPEIPPIGTPIANTKIYILNENRNMVPLGAPGELYIAGDNVGRGYCNSVELSRRKYGDDPFAVGVRMYRTGDLARFRPDGNIEFRGRLDCQVKIRGYRIEPGEIERRLRDISVIKQAVVVERENMAGEKHLCAYVVAHDPGGRLEAAELRNILLEDLADYMVPSYFVQLDRIPLTVNGKIDHRRLPVPEVQSNTEYEPPQDGLQERLTALWADVLHLEKRVIGINDNFFTLGGHSLKATVVIAKIQDEFALRVPLVEVFKTPTIKGLARYIEESGAGTATVYDDDLVLLKSGEPGGAHLFLVHDGSGEVEGYVEFCRHIDSHLSCWGIRAVKAGGVAPRHLTIEELAADYIGKIRGIQARGPYRIGGWSFGGTIAFEMVRQLEHMGEAVAAFLLIDAQAPNGDPSLEQPGFSRESELEWLEKFVRHRRLRRDLRQTHGLPQLWSTVVEYLERTAFDVDIIKGWIPENVRPAIPGFNRLDSRQLIYYLNLTRSFDGAWNRYAPVGKIRTPIHYFGSSRSGEIIDRQSWRTYSSGPACFVEIEGDHFSILKMPQVTRLAHRFSEALAASF
jgi:amino acid adenylation domain-containing protein